MISRNSEKWKRNLDSGGELRPRPNSPNEFMPLSEKSGRDPSENPGPHVSKMPIADIDGHVAVPDGDCDG